MNIIVIHSGGMDSTTLLYHLRAQGDHVKTLSINYGQRHVRELDAARTICNLIGVEHRVADLTALRPFLAGSSQTSDEVAVPHGHYTEASMAVTVIPNRNMLMLAVATAWAISSKFDAVGYAAHAGDHPIYFDCREEFVTALAEAIALADPHKVRLLRPFIYKTKAQIAALGAAVGVPFELTYSCYEGGEVPCGRCGTDVERREALYLAGVPDPTVYACSWEETKALLDRRENP